MTLPHYKGEQHYRAKMTEATIRELRAKYAAGEGTYMSLAREYGLALSTVGNILTRKTWKHV